MNQAKAPLKRKEYRLPGDCIGKLSDSTFYLIHSIVMVRHDTFLRFRCCCFLFSVFVHSYNLNSVVHSRRELVEVGILFVVSPFGARLVGLPSSRPCAISLADGSEREHGGTKAIIMMAITTILIIINAHQERRQLCVDLFRCESRGSGQLESCFVAAGPRDHHQPATRAGPKARARPGTRAAASPAQRVV